MRVIVLSLLVASTAPGQLVTLTAGFDSGGCVTCAESLESRLERVRGVRSVELDLNASRITLEFEENNRVRLVPLLSRISQGGAKLLSACLTAQGDVVRTDSGTTFSLADVNETYAVEGGALPRGRGILIEADATDAEARVLRITSECGKRFDEALLDSKSTRERLAEQFVRYAGQDLAGETAGEYASRMEERRKALAVWLGYPAPGANAKPELDLQQTGRDGRATYYRLNAAITADIDAYGLYIVPHEALARPAPLVIAQHGGCGYPELAVFQGGSNYQDMIRGAVERGYVVFAPHLVTHPCGPDREAGTPIPEDIRQRLDHQLRQRGTSLVALEVTRITAVVTSLLERPEIDGERVGMVGLSLGGMMTLVTTALDERIQVAVASGSPEVEYLELICPRALQLQWGEEDNILGRVGPRARRSAEPVVETYERLGRAEDFEIELFPGKHDFDGELAWRFLRNHLKRL